MKDNFVFPIDNDEELIDNIERATGNEPRWRKYLRRVYSNPNFKTELRQELPSNSSVLQNLLEMPLFRLKDENNIHDYNVHVIETSSVSVIAQISITPCIGDSISFMITIKNTSI